MKIALKFSRHTMFNPTFQECNGATADADAFTVCLLAKDKEDSSMYKLLKFNVSSGDERQITEVPYRKDCAIASLNGKLDSRMP